MTSFSRKVIKSFESSLSELDSRKVIDNLLSNPEADFTRDRKLNFKTVVRLLLAMAGKPLREELYDYFGFDHDTATSSAFVQARAKIKPCAFELLFHMLDRKYDCPDTYHGYRLIAVDGSDLSISYDPNDTSTLIHHGDKKDYNMYHINAAYDILNNRYVDMILQGSAENYEEKAMWTMVERYKGKKAIFIADRGYPSWNNLEHIRRSGQYFLIRCKDINSQSSILRKSNLPNTEFDLDFSVTLTTKQTKEVKSHPEKYRFLSTSSVFDYVDKDHPYCDVHYRAVRFKISDDEDGYESIITNLPRNVFSVEEIKELYHARWGIEVSFRHLKYSANLSAAHARKRESIQQEIWARMILYNLSMVITQHLNRKIDRHRKYAYAINVTAAIHLIRVMFIKRKGGYPPDQDPLIINNTVPIRPDRHNNRNMRTQSAVCFNYRFS